VIEEGTPLFLVELAGRHDKSPLRKLVAIAL
jgi:hypothetical protein